MRQRSNIDDLCDLDTIVVNGPDGRFPSVSGSFHIHLYLAKSCLMGGLDTFLCCNLGCIGSVLLVSAETHFPSGRPGDHIPLLIGQGDDDVVEGGADVRFPGRFNRHLALLGGLGDFSFSCFWLIFFEISSILFLRRFVSTRCPNVTFQIMSIKNTVSAMNAKIYNF